MYVYQADTWCDSCGAAIIAELTSEGLAPDDPSDEWTYDSDNFPKGAIEGETDSPDHCASRDDCLEAIDLADYGLKVDATLIGAESTKIGALLSDGLTEHGVSETIEMMLTPDSTPYQLALYALWRDEFGSQLSGLEPDDDYFESAITAYVECALWAGYDTSRGNDGNNPPLDDNFGAEDLSTEALQEITEDVTNFVTDNWPDVRDIDAEQAGYDLYLTRNHHGAGFWDRGLGEIGERLTTAAHAYGTSELYPDNTGGSLYVSH